MSRKRGDVERLSEKPCLSISYKAPYPQNFNPNMAIREIRVIRGQQSGLARAG